MFQNNFIKILIIWMKSNKANSIVISNNGEEIVEEMNEKIIDINISVR